MGLEALRPVYGRNGDAMTREVRSNFFDRALVPIERGNRASLRAKRLFRFGLFGLESYLRTELGIYGWVLKIKAIRKLLGDAIKSKQFGKIDFLHFMSLQKLPISLSGGNSGLCDFRITATQEAIGHLTMRALILTAGGLISARVLQAWLGSGHSVGAIWVDTAGPDLLPPQDRLLGLTAPAWSVSALARAHRIPIVPSPDLSDFTTASETIRRLNADVLISTLTLTIIPGAILDLFPGRAVNFHPALLPHYRGPNPRAGMILDGKAREFGGVTVHCLSPRIDEGDIIGFRQVPHDAAEGFIVWNVRQARAAGALVKGELQAYLSGTRQAAPQPSGPGSYRNVDRSELTLSGTHSAAHTKWLCDQFCDAGWIDFQHDQAAPRCPVGRFIGVIGPPTGTPVRVGRVFIEFDAADARVRVAKRGSWSIFSRLVRYLKAIVTSRRDEA